MSIPTDHDLDLSVASMLRFGVTLAAIVVFAGGVMYLRHPLLVTPNYQQFQAGAAGPPHPERHRSWCFEDQIQKA